MHDENTNSWEQIIEQMHQSTIEVLKGCKPGTLDWTFCINCLKNYELYYLRKEDSKNENPSKDNVGLC